MNRFKLLSTLFFVLLAKHQSMAQLFDEWHARPNIGVKYKVNKHWSVAGTYYHYLENNFTKYNKSVLSLDASYKINSWLKAGIDSRYGFNFAEDYYDIRYSVTVDFKLGPKWKVAYRPMLQQEFVSLKKEHLATQPIEYFLRNRISFSYEAGKKWEWYVFTENYQSLEKGDAGFFRQKSALGAEYAFIEQNKLGFRFEVINKRNGKMLAGPNLSYTYTFGYRKNKKEL